MHLKHIVSFDSLRAPWIYFSPPKTGVRSLIAVVCLPDSSDDDDKTKLVVGVVIGLLVAALVIGVAYWMYMKKSK